MKTQINQHKDFRKDSVLEQGNRDTKDIEKQILVLKELCFRTKKQRNGKNNLTQ